MSTSTAPKSTFLQRNKKKSALALLLLFLRERKILVLLLLLVFLASTVFISPSSWITGLPGGTRFAAGVAWLAGKMGVDTSRWGLGGPGKHSYADLLEAFREAKASHNAGGVGWGPFFGHGGAGSVVAGNGTGEGSLGFVKGSKSDLDHGVGAGAGGANGAPQSVAGIVDPADPKSRDGNAVALNPDDLGGQREGYADTLNGNGFMGKGVGSDNRLPGGGSGPGGDGSLSGGAYASQGFFSGKGGAAGTTNGLAKAGLSGLPAIATPAAVKGGAAKGSLSAFASRGVEARATKGVMGAASLSNNFAFAQAAEGKARDDIGAQCLPPSCPVEFQATNSGAIYDGNNITSGFLSSSDPGAGGIGLDNSAVNVPNDPGSSGTGADTQAQQIQTCSQAIQACQQQKTASMPQVGQDETVIQGLYNQLPGACGDPCNCGPCHNLQDQISAKCAEMKAGPLAQADAPCPPLPDYCAALGFSLSNTNFQSNAGGSLCTPPSFKCGCSGLLCDISCFLGS